MDKIIGVLEGLCTIIGVTYLYRSITFYYRTTDYLYAKVGIPELIRGGIAFGVLILLIILRNFKIILNIKRRDY